MSALDFFKTYNKVVILLDKEINIEAANPKALDFFKANNASKVDLDFLNSNGEIENYVHLTLENQKTYDFNLEANQNFFEVSTFYIEHHKVALILNEITQKTLRLLSLEESELKHRLLFTEANDAIVILSNLKIVDANQKTLQMFDCIRYEDILGKDLYNFMPEKQPDGTDSILKYHYLIQDAEAGETHFFNWKHAKLSGLQFDTEVSLVGFEMNQKTYTQVIIRDITKRVEAEAVREITEKNYRLLVESSPDAVIVEKAGKISFVNSTAEKIFNTPSNKIINSGLSDFFDSADAPKIKDLINRKIKNPDSDLCLELTLPEGGKQVELFCISVEGDRDLLIRYVVHDISFRKKAEVEEKRAILAEETNVDLQVEIDKRISAQEYTRSIIDSSIDMILIISPEGRVIDYNRAAYQGFGYQKSEFKGILVDEFFAKVPLKDEIINHLRISGSYSGEVAFNKKGNGTFIGFISIAELKSRGESAGDTVCIIKDISELKATELALKNNIKQKEVLLKEVHHRVKNNLQVINSLLRLQASYIDDEGTARQIRDCQDRIKSMAYIHESLYQNNDLALVDFKLYIQKIGADLKHSYGISVSNVDLKYKLEDVKLKIDTSIPCGLIINELISNSFKYAFPNRVGEITISLKKKDKNLVLKISDNGIGFPDDFTIVKSNSLGISLVQALVQQIDGTIFIDKKNQGANITIEFPAP